MCTAIVGRAFVRLNFGVADDLGARDCAMNITSGRCYASRASPRTARRSSPRLPGTSGWASHVDLVHAAGELGRSAQSTISIPSGGSISGGSSVGELEDHELGVSLDVDAEAAPLDGLDRLAARRSWIRLRRSVAPCSRAQFEISVVESRAHALAALARKHREKDLRRSGSRGQQRRPRRSRQAAVEECHAGRSSRCEPLQRSASSADTRVFGPRPRCRSRASAPCRPRPRRGESPARSYNTRTYGGDQVSTWSILRLSCKPRSPVGLVKQPGQNASAKNQNALALAA